jgi:hypothetical protein
MKKAFIILIGFLVAGCTDTDLEKQTDSITYFEQHLKADMKYEDLKSTFGKPDNDIGSGIHIYQYNLQDGTKIHIGFVDKILYARHVDVNDQLIEVLI